MATRDEVARQPLEQRRARLARTADDLTAAIHGQAEAVLARRPDITSWAATEVVCHLRDIEEMVLLRLEVIAALDEPMIAATGMGARILAPKPAVGARSLGPRPAISPQRSDRSARGVPPAA